MAKKNLKKKKYIIAGLGVATLAAITIAVPLSIKKDKNNGSIDVFKRQIEKAKNALSIAGSQKEIRKMYQYMTNKALSEKSEKAANALGAYIFKNKNSENFTFKYGHDKDDNNLELLIIIAKNKKLSKNKEVKPEIYIQNLATASKPIQIPWVSKTLKDAEFGVLFGLYNNEVASQTTIKNRFDEKDIKSYDFEKEKYTIYKIINSLQTSSLQTLTDNGNVKASTIKAIHIKNLIKQLPIIKNAINNVNLEKVIDSPTLALSLVNTKNSLEITVSYDNQKLKQAKITIKGFRDENALSNEEIVNAIDDKQIEAKLAIIPNKKSLPSSIGQPNDGSLAKNVVYAIKKWAPNDKNGEIEWTIELKINDGPIKSLSGTIGGYQTTSEAVALKLANSKKEVIKKIDIYKTSKSLMLTHIQTNSIDPLAEKTKYTQAFIDAKKAINNTTKLEDVNKIFNQEKVKIANLHLIYDNVIKEANKLALNNKSISDVIANLPDKANYLTNSEIIAVANEGFVSGDLGVEVLDTFGTTVTYSHATISKDGYFRVNFFVNKDSGTQLQKTIIVKISGLNVTKDLKTIKDVKVEDLKLLNGDPNVLPSTITKPSIGKTHTGVNFSFDKWEQNNETGKIKWEATLSLKDQSRKITGTISGFKKIATLIAEKIEKAKSEINAYKLANVSTLTVLAPDATRPFLEKNAYEKSFVDAKLELNKAIVLENVERILGNEKNKIDQLHNAYDAAIKRANFASIKTHAKLVLSEYWKTQNEKKTILKTGAYISSEVQKAWELARTEALNNVDNDKTEFIVTNTIVTEKENIVKAFNIYKVAITLANLMHAKNIAIANINKIKTPIKNVIVHDITFFSKISISKESAIKAINKVMLINDLSKTLLDQEKLVDEAIVAYNNSKRTELQHVQQELAKFIDATSLKNNKAFLKLKTSSFFNVGTSASAIVFGYIEPKFDSSVRRWYIIKNIYDISTRKIIITVKITIGKTSRSKDIAVKAGTKNQIVTLAATLFVDAISTKNKAELNLALSSKQVGGTVEPSDLGIKRPIFVNPGIAEVVYKIASVYNNSDGMVSVEVEINKKTAQVTKIIKIKASDA